MISPAPWSLLLSLSARNAPNLSRADDVLAIPLGMDHLARWYADLHGDRPRTEAYDEGHGFGFVPVEGLRRAVPGIDDHMVLDGVGGQVSRFERHAVVETDALEALARPIDARGLRMGLEHGRLRWSGADPYRPGTSAHWTSRPLHSDSLAWAILRSATEERQGDLLVTLVHDLPPAKVRAFLTGEATRLTAGGPRPVPAPPLFSRHFGQLLGAAQDRSVREALISRLGAEQTYETVRRLPHRTPTSR